MDKLPEEFMLPAELLGLSEIEVVSVKLTREGSFVVFVKSTRQEILWAWFKYAEHFPPSRVLLKNNFRLKIAL